MQNYPASFSPRGGHGSEAPRAEEYIVFVGLSLIIPEHPQTTLWLKVEKDPRRKFHFFIPWAMVLTRTISYSNVVDEPQSSPTSVKPPWTGWPTLEEPTIGEPDIPTTPKDYPYVPTCNLWRRIH